MSDNVSRPGTANEDMEGRSSFIVARVLSATERRINRLLSAGSNRSGSRITSAALDTSGITADSRAWATAEKVVFNVCKSWDLSDRWKFTIRRFGVLETKYLFEALFSIPTRRRPIPNATASVLFSVDPGADGFPPEDDRPSTAVSLDESTPKPLVIDAVPPEVTASGVHGRAQHLVGRVLSASDRIVSSIVDDSSRPGSNLSTVLSGLVVRFSLEAQDLLHNAADTVFSEQWLHNILAAKRSQFDIADAVLGDPDM
eukprot:m.162976 g.162976  ORF g.162976 m.162976 type:complete len:257 (-) comp18091_c0_seq4:179-949(-)